MYRYLNQTPQQVNEISGTKNYTPECSASLVTGSNANTSHLICQRGERFS